MNQQIKNNAFLPVKSPEYQAFIKTGFRFQNLKKEGEIVVGKLICVCGKVEIFGQIITDTLKKDGQGLFDFIKKQFLFDDAHLLEDGYTPEQIADIRQKYNKNLGETIG